MEWLIAGSQQANVCTRDKLLAQVRVEVSLLRYGPAARGDQYTGERAEEHGGHVG